VNKYKFGLVILIISLFVLPTILLNNPTAIGFTTDLNDSKHNNYYVSTSGNDNNPGTITNPWRTIQKAANSAKTGDVINIRGGNYQERVSLQNSGSDSEYITFTNYANEKVCIDGENIDWDIDWGCLFDLNGQSNIKIIGLRVINSKWAGIGYEPDDNGCQNVIIQNCSTYNTLSSGIAFFAAKNLIIDCNTIEKACIRTDGSQEGISIADVAGFEIKNNIVTDIDNDVPGGGGEGIDIKNGCSNGTIYHNKLNDIYKVAIYIDAYSKHEYNIEIYENTIERCGDGIAIASERGGLLENITIKKNNVFDCKDWGFVIAGWGRNNTHPMQDIYFIDNIAKDTGEGGIFIDNYESKNVVISYNIFSGGKSTPIYLKEGNLAEITINNNGINRVAVGHPTGTNYYLI
jgi:hypothetical protein